MSNDKITEVGVNIQEKATVIWNIANALFGYFKPHEYGLVILPMTVVKRFHDCLLPTHAAVREQYEKVKKLAVIDGFLTRASGYQFYKSLFNISPRPPWRHIFRPDCVKNPCNPSGLLRLFALQDKKLSRQSAHAEILNRL